MKGLRRFLKGFEDDMTAAVFAEAGEFETAREILRESEHAKATEEKCVSGYHDKDAATATAK